MNGAAVFMLMGLLFGGTVVSSVPDIETEAVDVRESHYAYDLTADSQSYPQQNYLEQASSFQRHGRVR